MQVEGKLLTKKDPKSGLDQGCFRFGFSADAFAYAASASALRPSACRAFALLYQAMDRRVVRFPGALIATSAAAIASLYRPSSTRIPARFDWMTGISELAFCARARSASWSAS